MAKKKGGIYADPAGTVAPSDKVADFSYENDLLADLIVQCWTTGLGNQLTTGSKQNRLNNAKAALADRGIFLDYPFVITEAEYDAGFRLEDDAGIPADKGVIFVLPTKGRATAGKPLLETAKMLMAITPNGI
jgi:hypothetical protein